MNFEFGGVRQLGGLKRKFNFVTRFLLTGFTLACMPLLFVQAQTAPAGPSTPAQPAPDTGQTAAGASTSAAPSPAAAASDTPASTPPSASREAAAKTPDDVRKDTPGVVIHKNKPLKLNVDLALINATVTDPFNRLVTGLDPDNFRIFEDNVEQEVVTFSAEDVPISIGVIFDYSGSMSNKAAKAREAAVQFFKTANPQDEFFLVAFNERAELTSSFTNSVEDLQSRMLLSTPKGRTALLDAIYLGLSEMRGAHNAKRALLILSDGGDNHSRYSESDIKRLVKEADTQLYAIGIFDPAGYRNRTLEEGNGPSLLGEVTELTGGRVFPVERLEDLPDIATKIGMELRNQYVLGYHPSNTNRDARWRKVKVKLRAPRGLPPLTVYAKTGYYAPSH
ncbi:MAG TPA: VWA domain-containing protein [Candidatus Dormibacteraeota bacterium]|nr:VWA domain-containing protein [Candidatus Dormibacteraeota bacterium]